MPIYIFVVCICKQQNVPVLLRLQSEKRFSMLGRCFHVETVSVVTEENEFHNICHLLTLFGVTDLPLIRGLSARVLDWHSGIPEQLMSGRDSGVILYQTAVFDC